MVEYLPPDVTVSGLAEHFEGVGMRLERNGAVTLPPPVKEELERVSMGPGLVRRHVADVILVDDNLELLRVYMQRGDAFAKL